MKLGDQNCRTEGKLWHPSGEKGKIDALSKQGIGNPRLMGNISAFHAKPLACDSEAKSHDKKVFYVLHGNPSATYFPAMEPSCDKFIGEKMIINYPLLIEVDKSKKPINKTTAEFDITSLRDKVETFCNRAGSIDSCWIKIDSISKKLVIHTVMKGTDFQLETQIFQGLYADVISSFSDYYVEPTLSILGHDELIMPTDFVPIYRSR